MVTEFVIFCFFRVGNGNMKNKLALLKERMHTLEKRLSEDISFLMNEFYSEVNNAKENLAVSVSKHTDKTNNTEMTEEGLYNAEILENVDQLKNELFSRLGVLQEAVRTEKIYRRDLQRQMGLEHKMSTDTVKTLSQIDDTIKSKVGELKIPGLMDLLEEIKELLRDAMSLSAQSVKYMYIDCYDLFLNGQTTSGKYDIHPDTMRRPLKVFCDMDTDGGGWTVFQRRCDGSENFYRSWNDYRFGFGNLSSEFWMGNEFIYRVTHSYPQEMRIELEDFENDRRYAKYEIFEIKSVTDLFQVHLEDFSGNVGDHMIEIHNDRPFSTFDKGPSSSCSKQFKGGFWYNGCHGVNVNGEYLRGEHESYADGVNWSGFRGLHYSLKFTEMKFRPK